MRLFPEEAPRLSGPPFTRAVVDFPWDERGGGGRGTQNHYSSVPVKEGPTLIIGSGLWRFAPHAHLYLWVTSTHDAEGHWLLEQLGFRYVTDFVWRKPTVGMGQYRRSTHERILLGTRGSGFHESVHAGGQPQRSVFDWPSPREEGRRVHSRKPREFWTELVEVLSHGPGVEFFARGAGFNSAWTVWGNEAQAPCEVAS